MELIQQEDLCKCQPFSPKFQWQQASERPFHEGCGGLRVYVKAKP